MRKMADMYFHGTDSIQCTLQGDILILNPKYNMYSMMEILTYDEVMKLRHVKRYYQRNEIEEAVKNPAIVHLTNSFLITNRAWYANSNHPRKALYEKYKMLTPWKDEPGFKDTRKEKIK